MAVRFVDNSDYVLRKVTSNASDAMKQVGELLMEAVQEKILYGYHDYHGDPPHTEIVDTGRLFDSIKAEVKKSSQNTFSTSVGTDVPYAGFVHDGTSELKGRPFITDAVTEKADEVQSILSDTLPKDL